MRRLLAAGIIAATFVAMAVPASADLGGDLAEVEQQMDDLEAAIDAAQGQRTELANQVIETRRRLEAVKADLAAAQEELAQTEAQIAEAQARLASLADQMEQRQRAILRLRADADRERQAALARAVDVYMSVRADPADSFSVGDPESSVGIVYADRVQNVADQVIATYELHRFQEQQEVGRLEQEQADAETRREALMLQEFERTRLAAAVEARARAVEHELEQQRALLDRIRHSIASFEGELAALAADEEAIRTLIALEQAGTGSAPGAFTRPVPGGVESGFGYRIHPIYGTKLLHTGWDMHGSCGTPIVAAGAGRVIFAGWKGGYGLATMIDHGGGIVTLYAHQSSIGVAYGQVVVGGEQIGLVGTTGVSTGCHLHWEVRENGTPVDPTPYL